MKKQKPDKANLLQFPDTTIRVTEKPPLLPIRWVRYSTDGEALATCALIRLLNEHLRSN